MNKWKLLYKQRVLEVCKNKVLQNILLEFFDDCTNYYKDVCFTKEDFDTLQTQDGVWEQDIVKVLFEKKTKVYIDEMLAYIFCNNLKKVDFDSFIDANKLGFYNTRKKEIHILNSLNPDANVYDKELNKIKNPKKRKDYKLFVLKCVVYHECNHLLEHITFLNGRVLKHCSQNNYSVYCKDHYIVTSADILARTNMQSFMKHSNVSGISTVCMNFLSAMIFDGYDYIFEARNDILANRILGNDDLKETYIDKDHAYIAKRTLDTPLFYSTDFDMYVFFDCLMQSDERLTRFHISQIYKEMNSIQASPDMRKTVSSSFLKLMKNKYRKEPIVLHPEQWETILQTYPITDALALMHGTAHYIMDEKKDEHTFLQIKILEQALLCSVLLEKFEIMKQTQPLHDVLSWADDVLMKVGDALLLPNIDMYIQKDGKQQTVCGTDVFTLEEYIQKAPEMLNLKAFSNFVQAVEQFAQQHDVYIRDAFDYFIEEDDIRDFANTEVRPYNPKEFLPWIKERDMHR